MRPPWLAKPRGREDGLAGPFPTTPSPKCPRKWEFRLCFYTLPRSGAHSATPCACVSSFFGSNAYVAWLPLLMGLSAAFRLSLQRELERPVAAPAVPTPAVPTQDVARVGQPKPLFKPAPANSYRFLGRRRRFRG